MSPAPRSMPRSSARTARRQIGAPAAGNRVSPTSDTTSRRGSRSGLSRPRAAPSRSAAPASAGSAVPMLVEQQFAQRAAFAQHLAHPQRRQPGMARHQFGRCRGRMRPPARRCRRRAADQRSRSAANAGISRSRDHRCLQLRLVAEVVVQQRRGDARLGGDRRAATWRRCPGARSRRWRHRAARSRRSAGSPRRASRRTRLRGAAGLRVLRRRFPRLRVASDFGMANNLIHQLINCKSRSAHASLPSWFRSRRRVTLPALCRPHTARFHPRTRRHRTPGQPGRPVRRPPAPDRTAARRGDRQPRQRVPRHRRRTRPPSRRPNGCCARCTRKPPRKPSTASRSTCA